MNDKKCMCSCVLRKKMCKERERDRMYSKGEKRMSLASVLAYPKHIITWYTCIYIYIQNKIPLSVQIPKKKIIGKSKHPKYA